MKSTSTPQTQPLFPRLMMSQFGAIYLQTDNTRFILVHPEPKQLNPIGHIYTSISGPTLYEGIVTLEN